MSDECEIKGKIIIMAEAIQEILAFLERKFPDDLDCIDRQKQSTIFQNLRFRINEYVRLKSIREGNRRIDEEQFELLEKLTETVLSMKDISRNMRNEMNLLKDEKEEVIKNERI